MGDETIYCKECGRPFTFSYDKQRDFNARGYQKPKRCPECASRRKSEREPGMCGFSGPPVEFGAFKPASSKRSASVSPLYSFGLLTFGLALAVAAVVYLCGLRDIVGAWLIAISLVTFAAYGYDKAIAGSERTRVPETVLLALALAGGTLGALAGTRVFHHKTLKGSFRLKFWLVVGAQVLLIIAYCVFRGVFWSG